jgi:hypothetical protein
MSEHDRRASGMAGRHLDEAFSGGNKNGLRHSGVRDRFAVVPPGRLERPHPAPEAGALSAELWGPKETRQLVALISGHKCTTRLPAIQGNWRQVGGKLHADAREIEETPPGLPVRLHSCVKYRHRRIPDVDFYTHTPQ